MKKSGFCSSSTMSSRANAIDIDEFEPTADFFNDLTVATSLLSPSDPPAHRVPSPVTSQRRVERWRGGLGQALRVTGPFGCRCPSIPPCSVSTSRYIEPDVRIYRIRLSDGLHRLVHACAHSTPFTSQYSSFHNLRTINGVPRPDGQSPGSRCFHRTPEVRSLPSTGVTPLQRYYGPVRLPRRPGLSLTGVRLGH